MHSRGRCFLMVIVLSALAIFITWSQFGSEQHKFFRWQSPKDAENSRPAISSSSESVGSKSPAVKISTANVKLSKLHVNTTQLSSGKTSIFNFSTASQLVKFTTTPIRKESSASKEITISSPISTKAISPSKTSLASTKGLITISQSKTILASTKGLITISPSKTTPKALSTTVIPPPSKTIQILPTTTGLSSLINESTTESNWTLYVTSANIKRGRLGNRMFIYASLVGIARSQDRRFILPPGSDLDKSFKLSYLGQHPNMSEWPIIKESKPMGCDDNLLSLPSDSVRIDGYLQCWKYFKDVQDEIRREFIFQDAVANVASQLLHAVYLTHPGWVVVGVHVRRTDFVSSKPNSQSYGAPEKSYFVKAFDWMRSKFPGRNLTFLVASDDPQWCWVNLMDNNVQILPQATPEVHLAVLTMCDHVVISGGTFGYWGAWLGRGRFVVYWTGYLAHWVGKSFNPVDYYPELWVGFGN